MAKVSTKKVVAKAAPSKVPAKSDNVNVDMLLEQYAGAGVSSDASDNTIPFIYLVQAMSPVATKANPAYIKGAMAGSIWPRGEKVVWDGDEGIRVIPCFFTKAWVEWLPERAGFVARYNFNEKPHEASLVDKVWRMPNGNLLQESREHTVLVLDKYDTPTPFVIAMTSTNLKSSKDWMTLMNRQATPKGNVAPAFAYSYTLLTTPRTNDKGSWYVWHAENPEKVTDAEELQEAIKIFKAFSGGTMSGAVTGYDMSDEVADDDNSDDHI